VEKRKDIKYQLTMVSSFIRYFSVSGRKLQVSQTRMITSLTIHAGTLLKIDWDAEEEVLRKQAEAAEKQMAALQKKRNLIQFKKRERELTTKNQERIKNNVNIAEKELRLRVQALRDEKDDRLSKVERFKGELKERIDALCRCYEEVSVRALTVGNAFEEAEKKLVDEARREVERESRRLEGEKEAELIKVRKKLLGE